MLAENKKSTQQILDQNQQTALVLDYHDKRISALENVNEQLKELRYKGNPTSEVKVDGIPKTCNTPIEELAQKILQVMNLSALCNDILNIREIKFKSQTSTSNNASTPEIAGLNSTRADKSIIIKFKSVEIKKHVLSCKRKHGPIKVSDLVEGGSSDNVLIFEMHPHIIYELRCMAKDICRSKNYKSPWIAEGTVFVRKDEESQIIPIIIEDDLAKIIWQPHEPCSPKNLININHSLHVAHINVNSLRAHLIDVENLLLNKKIDFLSISESWLTPDVPADIVKIDNYYFVRNDRGLESKQNAKTKQKYMQGGGVGFYVREGIKTKIILQSRINLQNEVEFLIAEFTLENNERILAA